MTLNLSQDALASLQSGANAVDPSAPSGLYAAAMANGPSPAAPEPPTEIADKGLGMLPGDRPVDAREGSLGEAAGAFAFKAADQLGFGVPSIILDHVLAPEQKQRLHEAIDRHGVAGTLGGATGFLGSLFVGGPLFKAASTLGKVAEAGIIGAEDLNRVKAASEAAQSVLFGQGTRLADPAAYAASARDALEAALPKVIEEHGAKAGKALEAATKVGQQSILDQAARLQAQGITDPHDLLQLLDHEKVALQVRRAVTEVAPGLSKSVLATVARYGVEGAVLSSPQAVANASVGDFKAAAESMVTGIVPMVIGGTLLDHGLPFALKKARGALEEATTIGDPAVDAFAQTQFPEGATRTGNGIDQPFAGMRERGNTPSEGIAAYEGLLQNLRGGQDQGLAQFLKEKGFAPGSLADLADKVQGGAPASEVKDAIHEAFDASQNAHASPPASAPTEPAPPTPDVPTSPEAEQIKATVRSKLDEAAAKERLRPIPASALTDLTQKGVRQVAKAAMHGAVGAVGHATGTGPLLNFLVSGLIHKYAERAGEHFGPMLHSFIGDAARTVGATNAPLEAYSRLREELPTAMRASATEAFDRSPTFFDRAKSSTAAHGGAVRTAQSLVGFGTRIADQKKDTTTQKMKRVQDLASQPTALSSAIAAHVQPLYGPAPFQASLTKGTVQNAVRYLDTLVPKHDPTDPFAPAWQPSLAQQQKFERAVEVASDPTVVLRRLKAGTLMTDHVEALKNMFPALYAQAVGAVTEAALAKGGKMTPGQRGQLTILLGRASPPYQPPVPPAPIGSPPPGRNGGAHQQPKGLDKAAFQKNFPSDATMTSPAHHS